MYSCHRRVSKSRKLSVLQDELKCLEQDIESVQARCGRPSLHKLKMYQIEKSRISGGKHGLVAEYLLSILLKCCHLVWYCTTCTLQH